MGWGGWSSLSRVGSGDGVSCGGRGRGDSRWRLSAGASTSIGWCWLPRVAYVASSPGGAGGGGVGVALLVVGGAGMGVVLAGGLVVPVGRVGVACVRCAALAVLDWLWCRGVGGRRPHGRRVGLWSVCNGWLLADGARWYEVWVGGLLVVVGRSY